VGEEMRRNIQEAGDAVGEMLGIKSKHESPLNDPLAKVGVSIGLAAGVVGGATYFIMKDPEARRIAFEKLDTLRGRANETLEVAKSSTTKVIGIGRERIQAYFPQRTDMISPTDQGETVEATGETVLPSDLDTRAAAMSGVSMPRAA
jgi:hypothetical protein